jgi:hypothetical protein
MACLLSLLQAKRMPSWRPLRLFIGSKKTVEVVEKTTERGIERIIERGIERIIERVIEKAIEKTVDTTMMDIHPVADTIVPVQDIDHDHARVHVLDIIKTEAILRIDVAIGKKTLHVIAEEKTLHGMAEEKTLHGMAEEKTLRGMTEEKTLRAIIREKNGLHATVNAHGRDRNLHLYLHLHLHPIIIRANIQCHRLRVLARVHLRGRVTRQFRQRWQKPLNNALFRQQDRQRLLNKPDAN